MTNLPDIVQWLSLVNYNAAGGTPVAVEEVLHDAAFANFEKIKRYQTQSGHMCKSRNNMNL